MKWRHSHHEISEGEQLARYAYVLGNVPAGVADKAYSAAFQQLPAGQREQIVNELRTQLPEGSLESVPDDPEAFATLMRDLHARYAIVSVPGAAALAAAFVTSPPVVAYFTTGDGGRIGHYKGPNVLGL